MVLYFGPAIFKISRLLVIAMSCVHIFACVFFRVKKDSAASNDDVDQFYISRNVDPNVSVRIDCLFEVMTKSKFQFECAGSRTDVCKRMCLVIIDCLHHLILHSFHFTPTCASLCLLMLTDLFYNFSVCLLLLCAHHVHDSWIR
jgi:hypothetical protein